MDPWEALTNAEGERHVIPVNDLRPHDESVKCWCHPKEDFEGVGVVVHNSLDRREFYESGAIRLA